MRSGRIGETLEVAVVTSLNTIKCSYGCSSGPPVQLNTGAPAGENTPKPLYSLCLFGFHRVMKFGSNTVPEEASSKPIELVKSLVGIA